MVFEPEDSLQQSGSSLSTYILWNYTINRSKPIMYVYGGGLGIPVHPNIA
jgi:hypothetical protein